MRGRITPIIASMLAVAITFAFVVGTTTGLDLLRLTAGLSVDLGPIGATVEAAEFGSLPFGKLAEDTVGEEAGDAESEKEKDDFQDAAGLSHLELEALVLAHRSSGVPERPSSSRARALLGVIGARGPPIG